MSTALATAARYRPTEIQEAEDAIERFKSAGEVCLRAQRRAGQWLNENIPHGGYRRSRSHVVTLTDLGISRMQSHRWRLLASVPDNVFEAHIVVRVPPGGEADAVRDELERVASELFVDLSVARD